MPEIIRLEIVDSTSNYAKTIAAAGAPAWTAVLADAQTGGRGRMGRSFFSGRNLGMYLSVILRPNCRAQHAAAITPLAAVAVRRAILTAAGISADIKWVNDLQIGGKKLCGILTELSLSVGGTINYAVCGIGINVAHELADFPPELREIVTSLRIEGAKVTRDQMVAAVLKSLTEVFKNGEIPESLADLRAEYAENCVTLGREVEILRHTAAPETSQTRPRGRAVALTDSFALEIEMEDGTVEIVSSGEVSVRPQ